VNFGRSRIGSFARIAACAALLTTTLFGQWLHNLQDHCAGHRGCESANLQHAAHCHHHSCGHEHRPSRADEYANDGKREAPPLAPHDHSSCVICGVLAQLVTSSKVAVAPAVTEPLFEHRQPENEFAAPVSRCSPVARGPPAEWVACS